MNVDRVVAKLQEVVELIRCNPRTPTDADWIDFGKQTATVCRLVEEARMNYPEISSMVRAKYSENWSPLQKAWWSAWERVK